MSDLHSVKEPPETPTEPERKVRTFRVLKRDENTIKEVTRWVELPGQYATTPWTPDAEEVGERYGEGDYLLIESTDTGSPEWAYGMRVVADRVYRLADDETTA